MTFCFRSFPNLWLIIVTRQGIRIRVIMVLVEFSSIKLLDTVFFTSEMEIQVYRIFEANVELQRDTLRAHSICFDIVLQTRS